MLMAFERIFWKLFREMVAVVGVVKHINALYNNYNLTRHAKQKTTPLWY